MIEGLTKSRRWFGTLWNRRDRIADKRALLMWGTKDPLFGEDALEKFEGLFSNRHVCRVPGCGRFIPEEAPQIATAELRWFLAAHALSEAKL
jgi:pimeloyl-ACP methyl ester carboxylesterase